jgi:hypothetical protein
MPNTLQIRRGLQAALPTGLAGELLFATDTKRFYISDGSATNLLQGAATLLTTGAIPFSDANGKLTMSASNLYWDNTNNRLGIGTASPSNKFSVNVGTISGTIDSLYLDSDLANNAGGTGITLRTTATSGAIVSSIRNVITAAAAIRSLQISSLSREGIIFLTSTTTPVETMRIGANGNILIGTTTDAGYKIDVNGTARVANKLSVGTPSAASALMEITSTTLGFLPPRMTTTQKNAIASPAAGLVVFDVTLGKLCVFSTTWQTITSL